MVKIGKSLEKERERESKHEELPLVSFLETGPLRRQQHVVVGRRCSRLLSCASLARSVVSLSLSLFLCASDVVFFPNSD